MADQSAVDLLRANLEAFGAGDTDAFKATLADNAVYDELGSQRRVEGREECAELVFGWRSAFPDSHAVIKSIQETSEGAVAELVWEATQTGDMEGPGGIVPATGAAVQVPASISATIEGGEITESRHYFDMFGLLQQVGAIPAQPEE